MKIKRIVSAALALILCLSCACASAGTYTEAIRSIHSSFVSGNNRATSAPQQQANGMYRCVELLESIAYALDQ